jgi:hypothetical protein
MDCFIWFEDNIGFRIMQFDSIAETHDVVTALPPGVDAAELMDQSTLRERLLALAASYGGILPLPDLDMTTECIRIR